MVKQPFTPAANQSAADMPSLVLLNHPPMIAPRRSKTAAAILRFLFQLSVGPANILSSFPRSQYTLVSTVVGISFKPNCLDVTLCIAAWKLNIGNGTSVMKYSLSPDIPGTTCPSTRAAAVMIRTVWRRKDKARVLFRRGRRRVVTWAVKKLPRMKKDIASRA
jgi:hypothetical protein